MKTKSKIPALRFKGFTDAWEQRKLSEGTSKIGDGLHGTPNYSDNGDVFFINGNNLVNGKIVITKETKLVTESNQSKDDKLLNRDTILMSINGTIGNLAWYNNERVMLGKSAAYLTVSNFDKKFIFSYLQTSTIKNYFLNNLTGTTIKNLGLKTIRDTTLFVPTLEEQQKIGSFFKQLDDTIALHQRKCDQTKELKKTMLQKMFPKKGERIPEIRFPEFTDEWEEKKLGEVVEREIKGKAKANMQGTKSIYLETEYLNGGETTFVDSDADIEEDDILILWDGSQAGTVYHGFFGALGSTLKAYRPKESGKFVYYQLVAHQEMIFQRYRTPNIPHVIKTFTDEFSVFTTSLSEQERIGNFFKHLDTLIALHQSKCDSLKELKKTLLRQLFV